MAEHEGRFAKKDGSWKVKILNVVDLEKNQEVEVNVIRKDGEEQLLKVKVFWIGEDKFGEGNCAFGEILEDEEDKKSKKKPRGKGKAKENAENEEADLGEGEDSGSEFDEEDEE